MRKLQKPAWLIYAAKVRVELDTMPITKSGKRLDAHELFAWKKAMAPSFSAKIAEEIKRFLIAFPENSGDWPAILASLKNTLGGAIKPPPLLQAIQTYFRISGV